MWWTAEDKRVLSGAEWDLFRLGRSALWDDVEMSDDDEELGMTGVTVFDSLRKADRLALLAQVARGLHDEGEPCPDLTALLEGTVAAVLAQLRYLIAIEIETDADRIGPSSANEARGPTPRHLVLAAIREANPDRELPLAGSSDVTECGALLDSPVEGRVKQGGEGLDVGDQVRVKLPRVDPERGWISTSLGSGRISDHGRRMGSERSILWLWTFRSGYPRLPGIRFVGRGARRRG